MANRNSNRRITNIKGDVNTNNTNNNNGVNGTNLIVKVNSGTVAPQVNNKNIDRSKNINKYKLINTEEKTREEKAPEVVNDDVDYGGSRSRDGLNHYQTSTLRGKEGNNREFLKHIVDTFGTDRELTFVGYVSGTYEKDGRVLGTTITNISQGQYVVTDHCVVFNSDDTVGLKDMIGSVILFNATVNTYPNNPGKYRLIINNILEKRATYDLTNNSFDVDFVEMWELNTYTNTVNQYTEDNLYDILAMYDSTDLKRVYKHIFGSEVFLHEFVRSLVMINTNYVYTGNTREMDRTFMIEMIYVYANLEFYIKMNPKGNIKDLLDNIIITGLSLYRGPNGYNYKNPNECFNNYCLKFGLNRKTSSIQSVFIFKRLSDKSLISTDLDYHFNDTLPVVRCLMAKHLERIEKRL